MCVCCLLCIWFACGGIETTHMPRHIVVFRGALCARFLRERYIYTPHICSTLYILTLYSAASSSSLSKQQASHRPTSRNISRMVQCAAAAAALSASCLEHASDACGPVPTKPAKNVARAAAAAAYTQNATHIQKQRMCIA